jgi:hypothetical protein
MRRAGAGEINTVEDLRHELHELCQPLTRLQWRLEIGKRAGDEATLRETVEGSLDDAREMTEWVRRVRAQLAGEQMGGVMTDGVIADRAMGEQA